MKERGRATLIKAIVFAGGMTSIGIELSASRLIAPYFGDSTFIWANLIGMTMLYLAIGYRFGGRVADRRPNPALWHTGPESEEHKILKRRIASEPSLVGLPRDGDGEQEFRLWSGDEVDVYFGSVAVGVEVKTASARFDELHRGIFQCVKYRAVLRAQQIHDRIIPTAECVFAIGGSLPEELRDLAQLLGVRFVDCLDERG